MKASHKIAVLGSANVDFFVYVHHIPAPGQTIQADRTLKANGGKGANQAVAVGKLGGHSQFIGQVGNDDQMKSLAHEMKEAGVDLHWKVIEGEQTGKAFIYVDESSGENSIVIVGGANMAYKEGLQLDSSFKKIIDQCDYLLLQKEVPMEIDLLASKYAHGKGKKVILDCGGRDDPIPPEMLGYLSYISPNQTELLRLDPTINSQNIVQQVRQKIIGKHPRLKVLLKLGSKGSAMITPHHYVQAEVVTKANPSVLEQYKIIDTVGAGDCFTGAYAVRHAEFQWDKCQFHEDQYRKCMMFGNSAAFLCITKKGAMPSMPTRKEVDEFMGKYGIK